MIVNSLACHVCWFGLVVPETHASVKRRPTQKETEAESSFAGICCELSQLYFCLSSVVQNDKISQSGEACRQTDRHCSTKWFRSTANFLQQNYQVEVNLLAPFVALRTKNGWWHHGVGFTRAQVIIKRNCVESSLCALSLLVTLSGSMWRGRLPER